MHGAASGQMQPQRKPVVESGNAGSAALLELSRCVGAMTWEEAIRCIVEYDAEALPVERVNYWTLREGSAAIYCEAGYVASLRSLEHGATLLESEMPEYFQAMREERVIDMRDVQTDPRCRGLRAYCAARGVASMLDVPVWSEGTLCGVLCHEHVGAQRRWTERDMNLVTSISQVVASARAAHAHTQAAAEARRAAFLDAISRELSSLDVHVVAGRAAALCVPKLADLVLLWVQNRENVLECIALERVDAISQGVTDYLRARGEAWRHESSNIATLAVRQRQSLLIPDIRSPAVEQRHFNLADQLAIQSFGFSTAMSVPLTPEGAKPLGAMTFLARDRHFGADDLRLAESIASRVAGALRNARIYNIASEAIRARDEILVVAAHELRTPLTALMLETDNMLRQARRRTDAAETARAERIASHVRRFGALVDHVLDALRIRAEGVTVARVPCDLATVLRARMKLMETRARAAGSVMSLECPPSLPTLADRAGIEKVIDALLDNAIKFGSGRPIAVSLRADGWAELSVRDQGMGIRADRLSAIFQPFERACPTIHFGGLGLGLYIAKAVVDAHGGSIATTSNPTGGSTFVVRLPLTVSSSTGTSRPSPTRP